MLGRGQRNPHPLSPKQKEAFGWKRREVAFSPDHGLFAYGTRETAALPTVPTDWHMHSHPSPYISPPSLGDIKAYAKHGTVRADVVFPRFGRTLVVEAQDGKWPDVTDQTYFRYGEDRSEPAIIKRLNELGLKAEFIPTSEHELIGKGAQANPIKASQIDDLRKKVKHWLDRVYPADLKGPGGSDFAKGARAAHDALAEAAIVAKKGQPGLLRSLLAAKPAAPAAPDKQAQEISHIVHQSPGFGSLTAEEQLKELTAIAGASPSKEVKKVLASSGFRLNPLPSAESVARLRIEIEQAKQSAAPPVQPLLGKASQALAHAADGAYLHEVATRKGFWQRVAGRNPVATAFDRKVAAMNAAAERQQQAQEQLEALENRIWELNEQRRGIDESTLGYSGVQRPPRAVGWTDRELMDFGKAHDVNVYESNWWEHTDPEAWAEQGSHSRRRHKTGRKRELRAEIAELKEKRDALRSKAEQYGRQAKAALDQLERADKGEERKGLWQAAKDMLRGQRFDLKEPADRSAALSLLGGKGFHLAPVKRTGIEGIAVGPRGGMWSVIGRKAVYANPETPTLYKGMGRAKQGADGQIPRPNDLGVVFSTTDMNTATKYADWHSGEGQPGILSFTYRPDSKIADVTRPEIVERILDQARRHYPSQPPPSGYYWTASDLNNADFRRGVAREIAADQPGWGELAMMDDKAIIKAVKSLGYDGVTDGTHYAFVSARALVRRNPRKPERGQMPMWSEGEDTPLFSGTPAVVRESPFIARETAKQGRFLEMAPTWDELKPRKRKNPVTLRCPVHGNSIRVPAGVRFLECPIGGELLGVRA